MTFFAPIPSLADRIRADEQAMRILDELKTVAHNLRRPPKSWDLQQKMGRGNKSFPASVASLMNAELIDRSEPSGRLSLTRAGWGFLGETPPIWMEDAE